MSEDRSLPSLVVAPNPALPLQPARWGDLFLSLARSGRNRWTRYLLALVVIFVAWQIIGGIPVIVVYLAGLIQDPFWFFLAVNLTFPFLILGLWIAVRFIHGRPFKTLITPRPSFSFSRAAQSFVVWFALNALLTVADSFIHPGTYELTFDARRWLIFGLVSLVLIPIQSSAEELLFRGYLLQAVGLLTRNRLIVLTVPAALFAVLHFANPEMSGGFALTALNYLLFGFFLALLTLRDDRLELALGLHISNNLFAALAVGYKNSALNTPTLFYANSSDPLWNLVTFVVAAMIAYAILFRLWRPAV